MQSLKYNQTHRKILTCGIRLLSHEGFENVPITRICQHAGISRATFYAHFSCKEQIIAEYYSAAEFFTDEKAAYVQSADNPWIALLRLQLVYISHICQKQHVDLVSRYLSWLLTAQQTEGFLQMNRDIENLQIRLIQAGQDQKIIRNRSGAYHLSRTVFLLHKGNLFQWCSNDGRFDSYADFFWDVEALFYVDDPHRGYWKEEAHHMPRFSGSR